MGRPVKRPVTDDRTEGGPTGGAGPTRGAGETAGIAHPAAGEAAGRPQESWIDPALTRVGILGGTFDPIHYGHLAIAEEVAEALELEQVLFVPAARPPHKLDDNVTDAADRAEMVRLAIADNPKFGLCRIELERTGPSYTADTLDQLADEAARQRVARELYFILSADAFAAFTTWHEPERVLARATLVVVPRPGAPLPGVEWISRHLPPAAAVPAAAADRAEPQVRFVDTVSLATSSTQIRERLAAGLSIRYLVPPAVDRYIREHRLYRSTKPARTV